MNSSQREIFCLVLLLSMTCLLSLFVHSKSPVFVSHKTARGRTADRQVVVLWRPAAFTDLNVFYVDTTLHETLVFVATPFTGSNFFSKLIRDLLLSNKHTKVRFHDLRGRPNGVPNSKESQTQHLQQILFGKVEDKSSFVISDVHLSDLLQAGGKFASKKSVSVTIVRHPLHTLLASAFYHRHGEELFDIGNTNKSDFLRKLSTAIEELDALVEKGDDIRTYANQVSVTVPFCGWNMSRCFGVHSSKAPKVLGRAKKGASAKNTYVLMMEDFESIPVLLEKISPVACGGLSRYFEEVNRPAWLDSDEVKLSKWTRTKLKNDNRIKLELKFYEWIKEKYYKQKILLLNR